MLTVDLSFPPGKICDKMATFTGRLCCRRSIGQVEAKIGRCVGILFIIIVRPNVNGDFNEHNVLCIMAESVYISSHQRYNIKGRRGDKIQ